MRNNLLFIFIILLSVSCDFVNDQIREFKTKMANDTLPAKTKMLPGDKLVSSNGNFQFQFQTDSNLVLTDLQNNKKYWESKTAGTDAIYLVVNRKGTLKLRHRDHTIWIAPGTEGSKANKLVMQNDGSLVLFKDSKIIWQVNYSPPTGDNTATSFWDVDYIGKDVYSIRKSGDVTVSINNYPPGTKIGDLVIMSVISNTCASVPPEWNLFKADEIINLMPNVSDIPETLCYTEYYNFVINPYAGSWDINGKDILLVYIFTLRGKIVN